MTAKTLDTLPAAASVGAGDVVLIRQAGVSKKADATLFTGGGGAVTSVAGRTGVVVLTKADVALSNVDNTSDANKPVSTAQAAADAVVLAASAPIAHVGAGGGAHANVVASGAAGFMTGADKAKLDGVASGATANTGTVTSASVVSANGFAGSVATATSTPAITITTTVTGLVNGNGTALAAAVVRTDYAEPTTALATGILKNTTGTGAHTIAVAGDFPTLNQSTTGNAATATKVVATDSRAVVTTPETLAERGVIFDFKANTTEGLSDGGTYFGEMTLRKYGSTTDWTGGGSHQLGFTDNGNVWNRYGTNTTWGAWHKLLDTGNFVAGTDYIAPTGSIAANTGLTSGQVVAALGYTPSAATSRPAVVISTNTTAVSGAVYVLTASLTLTLPASPSAGEYVMFANRSSTTTATIARNGQNIMGLAEDMTIDGLHYCGELMFADATRGWVLL